MKLLFRETASQDTSGVAAFLQRIFDIDPSLPLIAPAHLHWKSWMERPDWPGSRGYVMTREGEIAAHATVVPLSCVNGGQRLNMVHLIDWAADPSSVGSGVTLMKQIGRRVDAVLAVGGSEMTQKVLPALGFKECGTVTHFARPLNPFRRLDGQEPSLRLGAQFARSVLWRLQAPSPRTHGWTAVRIAPEQLASRAPKFPCALDGTAIFERTAEIIAYLLRCPVTPMELYSVAKDGVNRGYFLLAYAPGQVRIADFYLDSDDRDGWAALIQLAVTQAKKTVTAAEVVSVGSDSVTRQALLDSGFRARGDSTLRILPSKGVEFQAAAIRFHMIESDAAYLHANKPAFWA